MREGGIGEERREERGEREKERGREGKEKLRISSISNIIIYFE